MGCIQPKTHNKLYPAAAGTEERPRNFIHYLAEAAGKWQLVLYCLEEKKFSTLKLDADALNPACETVVIRGIMYCTGGVGRTRRGISLADLKSVSFLQQKNHLATLSSMAIGRCKHGVTEITNTSLCVVGGLIKEAEIVSGSEVYDVLTNTWAYSGVLNHPRIAVAVCSFNAQYVYAFGGKTKADDATAESNVIECLDTRQVIKTWVVIHCSDECCHINTDRMWCIQASESTVIVFGADKTTSFDTRTRKMVAVQDEGQRYTPDKRCEIRRHDDEINMILEAGGNLGVYSLSTRRWAVQPHIVLGL